MADEAGTALLQSLAGLLQHNSPQPVNAVSAGGASDTQAQTATALVNLLTGLAGALGNVASTISNNSSSNNNNNSHSNSNSDNNISFDNGRDTRHREDLDSLSFADNSEQWHGASELPHEADFGQVPSVEDFVTQNGLEPWAADALYLLSESQRTKVMATPLNLDHATNLNGVITSRIKEVAPVEQRVQMFIQLNGLAEGVADRMSTLTDDQLEKVMESTLRIQKANNPSGVAMRRITDVLRNERMGIAHGPYMSGRGSKHSGSSARHQEHHSQAAPSASSVLSSLVSTLTAASSRDRSRSNPPNNAATASMPRDIQSFVDTYSLEWWVGEVLARLSLFQRQNVMTDLGNMWGVRNPSGVVMARVKQVASVQELMAIFVDLNNIDRNAADELWALAEEHQVAVMAPGIYIQNARSPSVAARSRIRQVLAGNDAMGGAKRNSTDYFSARHDETQS